MNINSAVYISWVHAHVLVVHDKNKVWQYDLNKKKKITFLCQFKSFYTPYKANMETGAECDEILFTAAIINKLIIVVHHMTT